MLQIMEMSSKGRGRGSSFNSRRGLGRGALGAWRALNPAVLDSNTFMPRMFAAIRAEAMGSAATANESKEPVAVDPPAPQEEAKKESTLTLMGFSAKGMTGGVPRGSFGVPGTPKVVKKVVKKKVVKRLGESTRAKKSASKGKVDLKEIKDRHPSLSIDPVETPIPQYALNEDEEVADDVMEEGEGPSQIVSDKVDDDDTFI